jgi:hypothetical protein
MALSSAKWVLSAVASKNAAMSIFVDSACWFMCSARQYIHNINDLLTK